MILLFLLFPWTIFSIKIHKKSAQNAYFLRHASKIHQKWIKSATWRLQEAPKTPPRRPKTDFASVLGANLGPSWAPFSAQDSLQAPRTPPKGLLGNVLGRLGGVLGPLGGQKPTRASIGAVLVWFSYIFGRFFAWFLVDFWLMFIDFLVDF